ncbi:MAG: hypothetical protein JRF52_08800, partial [Deltaproteobacteria bacterium]|nr:hypothetical protein [Deltaproteobacteria bacterium]
EPTPSDFGGKISSLLIQDNRLKMGEMAHKKALEHNWDSVADEMEDIYLMQQGLDFRIVD